MEDNEVKISKYSTGVNINLRVDQLWKDTHFHSRTGQFNKWNLDLDCIWTELARDLDDKEDKEKGINKFSDVRKDFEEFDKRILKYGVIDDSPPEGFKKLTKEQIEARNKHYKILREKQIFLARLENKLGRGTTLKSDEDDDIE